jgi:hypothetical protein
VIININQLILSEQRIERILAERVWAGAARADSEDHQVCYVHDAHSEVRDTCTEEGGGGDDFECFFYADAY